MIITGDEGCGKTHTVIKWLNRRNNHSHEDLSNEEEDSISESSQTLKEKSEHTGTAANTDAADEKSD